MDHNTTAGLFIEESDDEENQDVDLHHNNNNNTGSMNNTQQLMNDINDNDNDTEIKSAYDDDEYDDYDDDEEEMPIKDIITMLTISWRNEKLSPDILEYEQTFVERVKDAIDKKEDEVDEMEHDIANCIHNIDNKILSASIYWYKKEIQRIKYILNSYLRIRIWKIQKYISFMLSDEDAYNRLSPKEQKFAKKYSDLNGIHFRKCFLRELPSKYQSTTEDPEMYVKPNLNKFVVMKANENDDNILIEDGKHHINLQKGNIFVARYNNFKHLVQRGTVDLI